MTTKTKLPVTQPHHHGIKQYFTGVARNLVISSLAEMKEGRFRMLMPDGSEKQFGDRTAPSSGFISVHDDQFFLRCLFFADIGLAESYIDGLCDISSIRNLISWVLLNQNGSPVLNESPGRRQVLNLLGQLNRLNHWRQRNSHDNSRRNISAHYDLGNNFFKTFLDDTMTYSSALFSVPSMSLEIAQYAKFERIARQLNIGRSDKVLDLGCGWGGLSIFLARNFGCHVTAVTISKEQYEYLQERISENDLEDQITLRLIDYRNLTGKFDKIVSVEMIEAVGDEYMDTFVQKLDSLLAPQGQLLMQMITCPDSRYEILKANVDFIQKHIFPGSLLPSLGRISEAMRACGDLFLVDLFDMTPSYVVTLKRWQDSFELNLPEIRAQGFDEKFIRKYRYYFEYCQAAFDMRNVSVVQATYSRPNNRSLIGGRATN
jgi:cyclopropane-fatty-acyl-phospholipid synthase